MQRSSPVLTIGIFAGSNWGVPQGEPYAIIDRTIEKFEEAHPGVRVQYVSGIQREDYAEWLAGEFLRGEEPDVFLLPTEDFELYAEKGGLRELSPLVEQDAEFSTEIYDRAAYQNGQHNGRLYALPCENMITLMFVNKTLLAREGADMPPLSWTWADFLALSQRLTKDTDGDGIPDQFGFYDYTWEQAAVSNGVRLFREDGKSSYFADPRMEETVRFLKDLEEANEGHKVTARDFDMGRVAFRPFTFAEYRTYALSVACEEVQFLRVGLHSAARRSLGWEHLDDGQSARGDERAQRPTGACVVVYEDAQRRSRNTGHGARKVPCLACTP